MFRISQIARDYNVSRQTVEKRLKNMSLAFKKYIHYEKRVKVIHPDGVRLLMSGRTKDTTRNNLPAGDTQVANQLSTLIREQTKMTTVIKDLTEQNKQLVKRVDDLCKRLNNQPKKDPPKIKRPLKQEKKTIKERQPAKRYEDIK